MWSDFKMKTKLQFSGEIGKDAQEAFKGAIEESNKVVFWKGVPKAVTDPKNVGQITGDPQFMGNSVELEFASGPYTRVHDALFRFRKQIAPVMGRHRIGLREIEIKEFSIKITGDFPEEFRIPKLPFIRESSLVDGTLTLVLEVTESDLENKIPDRLVRLVEEKIQAATYGGKGEHWDLVFESGIKPRFNESDPTEEMVKRGWIKHSWSRGQWIHGPQSVQLFRAFEKIVLEEIIRPMCFSEMIFPKLVPWDVWKRSGHAKGVYPEIYYVCTPKTRDPAYWEDIGDYFKVTGEVWTEEIRKRLDGPIGGLCYAQCPPFWPFLQGETLANDCLPIRVFDRSGTSHRYESGGIHGIERVDEFHRIEVLWLGTAEQTVKIADDLHEAYHHVFEDILELEWRSAQVTPWFMAQEGMIDTGEGCECGERIGTMDYEAYLPYSKSWLEFQNVSINGDKYPKGFSVKIQSGAECWSGCSGIGLERWTAAFLAQKGLDIENWPNGVAEIVDKFDEVFRFL
ncbi:MAG TPA: serine--tRNA ligase [Methanoregulaceae archaeon]|nr:serine--tRNA ligase [Methanoregulaceae archaeon]